VTRMCWRNSAKRLYGQQSVVVLELCAGCAFSGFVITHLGGQASRRLCLPHANSHNASWHYRAMSENLSPLPTQRKLLSRKAVEGSVWSAQGKMFCCNPSWIVIKSRLNITQQHKARKQRTKFDHNLTKNQAERPELFTGPCAYTHSTSFRMYTE
jgi:hypothetical protein